MKLHHLLLLSVLSSGALSTLGAADTDPAATAPAEDFSAFKTADELWQHLTKLQKPPTDRPASREEAVAQARTWIATMQAAAEAFRKSYSADPRRWDARLLVLRTNAQLARISGQPSSPTFERTAYEEILQAADASAKTKGEAAFLRAMTYMAEVNKAKPETFTAFHKAAGDFLAKYPESPLAAQMLSTQLRVLGSDPTTHGAEVLDKLAASADAKTAEAAKELVTKRDKMANLKTKPLELQFVATNKTDVDLALMRGKVVLVDFWASWCGPCIAEMPNVVATYQKLHGKGFEIVGISLDQDKAKMDEAVKTHGMEWLQYFDGGGWKNKISSSFGIDSIPAAWLIDKKGMLRESGLRGPALEQAVEKLLKE